MTHEVPITQVSDLPSLSEKVESLNGRGQAWQQTVSADFLGPSSPSRFPPNLGLNQSIFQAIFHQIAEKILLLDSQTKQLLASNIALENYVGYTRETLTSLTIYELIISPEEIVNSHLWQTQTHGQHVLDTLQLRAAGGAILTVTSSSSLIVEQGRPLICLVLREAAPSIAPAAPVQTHPQPVSPLPTNLALSEKEGLVGAIAQRIRYTLNLDTLVATAAQELGQLLQTEWLAIVRYFPEEGLWRHIAEYRKDAPSSEQTVGLEIPDANNPVAAQLKRFQVVQIHNSHDIHDAVNAHIAKSFPASWLLVPLQIDNTLWGSMSLGQHKPNGWQAAEIELVQAAASQLMIAIQHSQLYQQVQHLNAELEQTVRNRTSQLRQALSYEAMLKRITDKVRDSLDERHILETAVEELAMLFGVECCDTALYNTVRQTCTIAHEFRGTLPSALSKTIHMAESHPEIYRQLLTCQYVHFCCMAHEARPNLTQRAVLACPIFDNQGVLGDIWLFRPGHERFDELEIRLVQQVANQCAIAIRQARLYQTSQSQVEALEHINQLKDNFLSTVSHELRTPIATIKMAIQMLTLALGREGLLPEPNKPSLNSHKIAHYLKILNDECNREINLITDLLDLQRLEAGTQIVNIQPIEIPSYIKHIVSAFQNQVVNQTRTFQIDIAPDLPTILSDAQNLERILIELLTNACKYTPQGEWISVKAECVTRTNQGRRILLTVTNSGVEIPANQLGQIFDKFYRIPSHDPHQHSGTGLGLALVKQLALQLGGNVGVESGNGQTSFTIDLPAC